MFYDKLKTVPRAVWIGVGIGALGGLLVGALISNGRRDGHKSGGMVFSDLPEREIEIQGGGRHKVSFASQTEGRAVLWLNYVQKPKATLFEWPKPGVYPVLDVPQGWVVVWIRDGKVLAMGKPSGERFNMLLPPGPVDRAAVLPDGSYLGGATVKTWSQN